MNNATAPAVRWQPVTCAFCGSAESRYFDHRNWPWPTKYVRCQRCGLIYLQPRPHLDTALLHHLYDGPATLLRDYEVEAAFSADTIQDKHYRRYADSLDCIRAAHPDPGLLVDVGTGNGLLMILAQRHGWQAIGIDVSEERAQVCRNNFKLDVRTGTLESVRLPPDSVDAIALRHVLEHVEDPVALLKEGRRVLRVGGVLLIEVPNALSLERGFRRLLRRMKLRRPRWPGNMVPMHLFEFAAHCLAGKADALGFDVLQCRSYSHPDRHGPLTLAALRLYHRLGWGTKIRLVLRKRRDATQL